MRRLLRHLFARHPTPPTLMAFPVRLLYTELVRGRPRSFQHEIRVEARDESEARGRATEHFDGLTRESRVGWARRLDDIEVLVDGMWRPGAATPPRPAVRRRVLSCAASSRRPGGSGAGRRRPALPGE